MGRRGPARALAIGFVASLVLALTVGASLLPAGGAPRNPKANRFGPSGVVNADPVASREQAARARAQAATAAASEVASVPGPSVAGSSGCRDTTAATCASTRSAPTRATPRSWAAGRARTRPPSRSTRATPGSWWPARTTTAAATAPAAPAGATTTAATGAASWPPSASPPRHHRRRAALLGRLGRPVGGVRLQRRGLPVLPGVQPRRADQRRRRPGQRAVPVPLRRRRRLLELPRQRGQADPRRRQRRHRPARQAVHGDRHLQDQPLPRPHLRRLGRVQRRLHRRPDRLRLVRRPRRHLEPGPGHQRHLAGAVPGHLRRLAGRHLQRQPVPAAVHRAQRRPVRGLPELQQRGRPRRRQPQPDPDREVHRRRPELQRAGQGQRLQRPARLPDLHRPRRRPRLRADRAAVGPQHLPRHQLPLRGRHQQQPHRGDAGQLHQPALQPAARQLHPRRLLHHHRPEPVRRRGRAQRLQQRHRRQRLHRRRRQLHRHHHPGAELPSVSDERPGRLADQWWQWAARNPKGGVTVAYYDRKYGDAQQTGFMDITMRRGNGGHVRVTNRSMPPTQEFPEAGASTGIFLGDYMGLAVGADGVAHPIWTDTRNPVFSPSTGGDVRELVRAGQGSDIYTRSLPG